MVTGQNTQHSSPYKPHNFQQQSPHPKTTTKNAQNQNLNPTTTKPHTQQHLTTKPDELPSAPRTQQSKQNSSMVMF